MYEKPSARYLISSKRSVKVNVRSREMGVIGRLRSVHTFWGRLKIEGLYTAETEDTYTRLLPRKRWYRLEEGLYSIYSC